MAETLKENANREEGFTLIELLIAIVVVGILAAVAIVGIAGLTNNGNTAACQASADAVRAANAVFYANTGGYATSFDQLAPTPISPTAPLVLAGGVVKGGAGNVNITNGTWTIALGVTGSLTITPANADCV